MNTQECYFQDQLIRNEIHNELSKDPHTYCWVCMKENHNSELK